MKMRFILAFGLIVVIGFMVYFFTLDPGPKPPSIENIVLDNSFVRFDQKVDSVRRTGDAQGIEELISKFPGFGKLFFTSIVPIIERDTSELNKEELIQFMTDPFVTGLQDTIDLVFGDGEKLEEDCSEALKYFQLYFPERKAPNIYFCNSLFNYQSFIFNDGDRDGIGIGLDMFLNKYINYKSLDPTNPAFSDYLTRSFNPDHVAKKVCDMLMEEVAGSSPGVRLLDQMIHNGKKLYTQKLMLPYTSDTIIMEYSLNQYKWCVDNELQLWSFFLDENLFYETSVVVISKYINQSPDAPGMPQEAPGRTANFIGYKIVQKYVEKFPETSIQDLFAHTDSQLFLEESGYRPRRK